MKRRDFFDYLGLCALLYPVAAGCSPAARYPDSRRLVDAPQSRAEYLAKLLEELCTGLGPHPIGSPELDQAALIVKREMELALPVVELDRFTFDRWILRSEPEFYLGDRRLETYPGHGTSGTPEEGIAGVLEKIEDEGGIPYGVVDKASGEIKAYVTLSRYGKAVPLPCYSFGRKVGSLPAFNVGLDDVPLLEQAAADRSPVRVKAQVEFVPGTATGNVVGTLPGRSEEEILYLAHLDTVYNSPGANDNTASVIAMLMIAHAFSGKLPEKTLTFVATTGEEYDKLGAINYAGTRKQQGSLENIRFLVNLDSVTWGPNMKISTADEELWRLIRDIDRELNLDGTPVWDERDGFKLDARPFRETGARAVYVNSDGYDLSHLWHRPEDTPQTVPVDCVEIWFRLFYEFTRRIMAL